MHLVVTMKYPNTAEGAVHAIVLAVQAAIKERFGGGNAVVEVYPQPYIPNPTVGAIIWLEVFGPERPLAGGLVQRACLDVRPAIPENLVQDKARAIEGVYVAHA
ncbi:MAG TPA: hypothetical protein VGH44_05040 [Candidatus Saccharimonadia bacterium]|jgi:hypothetical protein